MSDQTGYANGGLIPGPKPGDPPPLPDYDRCGFGRYVVDHSIYIPRADVQVVPLYAIPVPADADSVRAKLSEGGIRQPDTAFERTTAEAERHRGAILDHVFGKGTHERWIAEQMTGHFAAQEAEGIRTGRIRKGNRSTWYARITWSWDAWLTLWPKGERR